MSKREDWEEEVESLEDMVEEELEEGDVPEGASDDFKALFDDADETDEDDEDFLDEEGLSSDEMLEMSEEVDEEGDEDSLPLEEAYALEEQDIDDDEDELFDASAQDGEEQEEKSLASKFEEMTEEADEARAALGSEEEDENLDLESAEQGDLLEADSSISEDSELGDFESAEIEEKEFVDADTVISVVESVLFSTDKAVGIGYIKKAFEGTTVKTDQIRKAIESLQIEYAGSQRGVFLEEVSGGYQLRTKVDNINFLKRITKGRPFKLSGPALEVLAICAYKQPLIKAEVDEIRGVESGHLMRALMDRSLLRFAGKSDLPGKPMLYETTKKFLEIFSLRSLKELPSLSEIDELIPEGIGEEEAEKEHLSDVTDSMSVEAANSYSEGEEELGKIEETLGKIDTTTEFFEQEKAREKARQEKERADGIREALEFGEEVAAKDKKWLDRYDKKIEEERLAAEAEAERLAKEAEEQAASEAGTEDATEDSGDESAELLAMMDESSENLSTENVDNSEVPLDAEASEAVEEISEEAVTDESDEVFANESEESVTASPEESSEENEDFVASTDQEEVDELDQLLADEATEPGEVMEETGDESALLFAEESIEEGPTEVSQEEALDSAFGNIQNALEAFEGEDGIDIDAEPENLETPEPKSDAEL